MSEQAQTRLFDWDGLGEFLNELWWEGLPGQPEQFTLEGVSDDDRYAFTRIFNTINDMNLAEPEDEDGAVAVTLVTSDWELIDRCAACAGVGKTEELGVSGPIGCKPCEVCDGGGAEMTECQERETNEGRLFDFYGLGEFLNELHYEGFPDYDKIDRQDLQPSLEAACREGFTTDGEWTKVTDDERRRLTAIFDTANESQRWFDTMEPVEEEPMWDEDDPERPEGERHSGSPILVILQKSDWALIDRLPLLPRHMVTHVCG